MNFSVQVLCCTAPLLMVKASSHGKQFLLIPDYLLEITFAHKCPVRTSCLLTSLDSQLLTMQHNLQVAPITSGLRCHLCAHQCLCLDRAEGVFWFQSSIHRCVHGWLLTMLTCSVIMRPLITDCYWWITHIIFHLFKNKDQQNIIIETLCSVTLGFAAAQRCAHHTGRADCAVVSHDAGPVFSIGSKEVQVSVWVLSRVMGASGSSAPSFFLALHSLKNFISLIWFFFVPSQI